MKSTYDDWKFSFPNMPDEFAGRAELKKVMGKLHSFLNDEMLGNASSTKEQDALFSDGRKRRREFYGKHFKIHKRRGYEIHEFIY